MQYYTLLNDEYFSDYEDFEMAIEAFSTFDSKYACQMKASLTLLKAESDEAFFENEYKEICTIDFEQLKVPNVYTNTPDELYFIKTVLRKGNKVDKMHELHNQMYQDARYICEKEEKGSIQDVFGDCFPQELYDDIDRAITYLEECFHSDNTCNGTLAVQIYLDAYEKLLDWIDDAPCVAM